MPLIALATYSGNQVLSLGHLETDRAAHQVGRLVQVESGVHARLHLRDQRLATDDAHRRQDELRRQPIAVITVVVGSGGGVVVVGDGVPVGRTVLLDVRVELLLGGDGAFALHAGFPGQHLE